MSALRFSMRFLRTLIGWPLSLLYVCGCASLIAIGGESDFSEEVLRHWARMALRIAGARLRSTHLVPLDPHKSYVFVCNHTSNLDAPALIASTKKPLRFIAKRELLFVPFFGIAGKRMGHVFVDRSDKQAATRAIRRRIDKGLEGVALFFFAEGTRATTEALLPFKKGAAIAALESGLDVVPVAIAGAREVLWPKGLALFRPGPVGVVYGVPIPVARYTLETRDALVAAQREAVEALLPAARALVAV